MTVLRLYCDCLAAVICYLLLAVLSCCAVVLHIDDENTLVITHLVPDGDFISTAHRQFDEHCRSVIDMKSPAWTKGALTEQDGHANYSYYLLSVICNVIPAPA